MAVPVLTATACVACACLVFAAACTRAEQATVRFGDTAVHAFVADDPGERDRGLQGRTLGETEGMLFVWPDEGTRVFGIKGVDYPLDLVFMDGAGRVVDIAALDLERSTVASSPARARFVLEVPAGFVARHEVVRGDKADLRGID